jgi:two-component system, NtrC family, response regulator HydG
MSDAGPRVLFVDDDAATRKAMALGLTQDGYAVTTASSAEEALSVILSAPPEVLVTDLVMGGMGGIGLLRKARELQPGLPVVLITGYGNVDSAVEAMREGATDYLTKPVRFEALGRVLSRLPLGRGDELGSEPQEPSAIVGRSEPIRRVLQRVAAVAAADVTVLVRGESGTGKELVARALHEASPRAEAALVAVNCAAVTESLAESELFGHEKGAFTGAVQRRKGKMELAHGGTLFLDEVGDLSPGLQTKLLRALQERVVERVGGSEPIAVDVRIVAATNRDLETLIREGRFREDLYYRLRVVTIDVPPLRDRVDDVPVLARHFLAELAARHGYAAPPDLGRGVMDALRAHGWPGNVRELQNLIEELVITGAGERIQLRDLPHHLHRSTPNGADGHLLDGTHSLDEIERAAIQRTMARTHGNKAEAARILGIGLKTLYRKLDRD